jgi:hypothetical protein
MKDDDSPITMEESWFDTVMSYLSTLFAGVGMVSVFLMIAFWLGYCAQ